MKLCLWDKTTKVHIWPYRVGKFHTDVTGNRNPRLYQLLGPSLTMKFNGNTYNHGGNNPTCLCCSSCDWRVRGSFEGVVRWRGLIT